MSRRRRKKRAARKPAWTLRRATKTTHTDPLDDFIAAGARSLKLKIAKGWMPAVRTNLQVTLQLGELVASFELPDDAEPAPVFKA